MNTKILHGGTTGTMRWLVLVMVLAAAAFLMAGCGSSDAEEPETTEAVQEETTAAAETGNWYDSVLADNAVKEAYPYYRLLDIDQDGVDELFLSSTEKAFIGNQDQAKLMAEVNGEAATLKEIGGAGGESFSYDANDKALFYFSRLSGEEHIIKYALENGELKELVKADEYDDGHDPENGNNREDTYYIDGEKVTEAKADAIWDQFDDIAVPVSYSADGTGSPLTDDDADEPDDDDDGYDDDDEYDD